ncbi:MAG TPA: hypothetical protein VHN78_04755, partial [Chloroflexota bacterium]|nr:hypothetical protein [Chloroflexota bacterium]
MGTGRSVEITTGVGWAAPLVGCGRGKVGSGASGPRDDALTGVEGGWSVGNGARVAWPAARCGGLVGAAAGG